MKYHIDQLKKELTNNSTPKFLFFWGHQSNEDGTINKSCFSQWWDQHPFEVNGQVYPTAEHWMMAEKARLFKDEEQLAAILACTSPGEAKKRGRMVQHFNSAIWDAHRYEIVKMGNLHKFSQHAVLNQFLIGTHTRTLVEASPLDQIWGIGLAENHSAARNPMKWKGLNLLGFALMEVRDLLMTQT